MSFRIEVISPSYSLRQSNAWSCQIQDVQRADLPTRHSTTAAPDRKSDPHGSPVRPYGYLRSLPGLRVHRPVKDHSTAALHDRHRHADITKFRILSPSAHASEPAPHANYSQRAIPAVISIPYHDINMKNCKRYWIRYRHKPLPPVIYSTVLLYQKGGTMPHLFLIS